MAFLVDTAMGFLEGAKAQGRLGHAYLLSGESRGPQEELALRLIGMATGCTVESFDDVVEAGGTVVRPESKSRRIKVDQVRALERALHMGGGDRAKKVGVIVDADRLQEEAANAFLKTLEEPPPGVLLLLLTLHPEQLLVTVLSRCIRVPLYGGDGGGRRPADEGALLEMLGRHFSRGGQAAGGVGAAMAFKNAFSELLKSVKGEIADELGGDLKDEEAKYKKRTEGDYLDKRENYYEALTEARYLQRRAVLLGVLGGWFGDAMRQKLGLGEALDYPDYGAVTAALGQGLEMERLLERVNGVEFLRRQLETNVQEALALEVGFLKILG